MGTNQVPKSAATNLTKYSIYYFCYDHHFSWQEFLQKYPESHLTHVAYIRKWAWIVTKDHKINVRPQYVDSRFEFYTPGYYPWTFHSPRISSVSTSRVYGYLFCITEGTSIALEKDNPGKVVANIDIIPALEKFNASTFQGFMLWDPINASDLDKDGIPLSKKELKLWRTGLLQLRSDGVPRLFCNISYEQMIGAHYPPERQSGIKTEVSIDLTARLTMAEQTNFLQGSASSIPTQQDSPIGHPSLAANMHTPLSSVTSMNEFYEIGDDHAQSQVPLSQASSKLSVLDLESKPQDDIEKEYQEFSQYFDFDSYYEHKPKGPGTPQNLEQPAELESHTPVAHEEARIYLKNTKGENVENSIDLESCSEPENSTNDLLRTEEDLEGWTRQLEDVELGALEAEILAISQRYEAIHGAGSYGVLLSDTRIDPPRPTDYTFTPLESDPQPQYYEELQLLLNNFDNALAEYNANNNGGSFHQNPAEPSIWDNLPEDINFDVEPVNTEMKSRGSLNNADDSFGQASSSRKSTKATRKVRFQDAPEVFSHGDPKSTTERNYGGSSSGGVDGKPEDHPKPVKRKRGQYRY